MTQIELGGETITDIPDQSPLSLRTSGGWLIGIESSLTLVGSGEPVRRFEGEDPDALPSLAARLTGATIKTATTENGSLHLVFADGLELTVDPDQDFEAWEVTGPAGQRIVCIPGGELAIWSGDGQAE